MCTSGKSGKICLTLHFSRDDKRNDKGMPVAHKNYLTDRREQHGRRHAGPKAIGKLSVTSGWCGDVSNRKGILWI